MNEGRSYGGKGCQIKYSCQNLVSDFGFYHWVQGVLPQMIDPKISALSIHKKLHKHFFKNNNCIN